MALVVPRRDPRQSLDAALQPALIARTLASTRPTVPVRASAIPARSLTLRTGTTLAIAARVSKPEVALGPYG